MDDIPRVVSAVAVVVVAVQPWVAPEVIAVDGSAMAHVQRAATLVAVADAADDGVTIVMVGVVVVDIVAPQPLATNRFFCDGDVVVHWMDQEHYKLNREYCYINECRTLAMG